MSGLEDLYREVILDHYKNPRNQGELSPPAHRCEGFNPLCGDEVVVYLHVVDNKVEDIKIGGHGCSISQSSASMMTAAVKGKTVEETTAYIKQFKTMMAVHSDALEAEESLQAPKDLKMGDLEALKGVVKFPVRIKCATLSWNTLDQALTELADSPAVAENNSNS